MQPQTVYEAAHLYIARNISVIPLRPHSKQVIGQEWRVYQTRLATEDELRRWFDGTDYGVGTLGGAVSGNLVQGDCDDPIFSAWIESRLLPAFTRQTPPPWVVRTGSGKIHIKIRSIIPVGGSPELKNPLTGKKVFDVKADGGYVVSPPSIHETTGLAYATILGGPEHIPVLPDWSIFFRGLIDLYNLDTGAGRINGSARIGGGSISTDQSIMPPLPPEEWAQIVRRIRATRGIPKRVVEALEEGAEAGDGSWGAFTSSEIDLACYCALREHDFGRDEMEPIWATSPLGDNCYRRRKTGRKGSVGHATIALMQKFWEDKQAEPVLPEGENWTIRRNVRLEYDKPRFRLTVARTDVSDVTRDVEVSAEEIMHWAKLKPQIASVISSYPSLKIEHRGNDQYVRLAHAILAMAEDEFVPATATTIGQVRDYVLSYLKQPGHLADYTPDRPEEFSEAFFDAEGACIFVRPRQLSRAVAMSVRPSPGWDVIWKAMVGLGAEDHSYHFHSGGTENLWRLPLDVLEKN